MSAQNIGANKSTAAWFRAHAGVLAETLPRPDTQWRLRDIPLDRGVFRWLLDEGLIERGARDEEQGPGEPAVWTVTRRCWALLEEYHPGKIPETRGRLDERQIVLDAFPTGGDLGRPARLAE